MKLQYRNTTLKIWKLE